MCINFISNNTSRVILLEIESIHNGHINMYFWKSIYFLLLSLLEGDFTKFEVIFTSIGYYVTSHEFFVFRRNFHNSSLQLIPFNYSLTIF